MKKRILSLLLTALMLVGALVPASAADVVLGVVRYTQIVAYIDGYPIRSYNINDNTYIVVEDLSQYGFGVVWDGATGKLHISEQRTAAPANYTTTYQAPAITQAMINSEVAMNYYETKVTTWIGPNQINGYNIGGFTCIFMDDLARFFAAPGGYAWVPEEKALKMVSPAFGASTPSIPAEIPATDLTAVVDKYIKDEIATVKNRSFTGADATLMQGVKSYYGDKLYDGLLKLADEFNGTVSYRFTASQANGATGEVTLALTTRDLTEVRKYYAMAMDGLRIEYNNQGKSLEDGTFSRECMTNMIELFGDDTLPTATQSVKVTLDYVNGAWTIDEAKNAAFITALTGGLFDKLLPPTANKAA